VTLLPLNQDMTSRDFDSLRARLISLARSAFPEWTDFQVASFGTVLLEAFAHVGDVLAFYLDHQARESRLTTATQRVNVIAHSRLLGYRLPGAVAATAELLFSANRTLTADVTIPAETIIRTPEILDPIVFRLLEAVTLRAGQSPAQALGLAVQAEPQEQRIDSRGLPNLEVLLERTPFLDRSLRVETPLGDYTEVDTFLLSGPTDRHFTVAVDQYDRARIRFGDGRAGLPPQGTVVCRYRTGGGSRGNLDRGQLTVLEGTFADAHGRSVQLQVTNPEKSSGGVNRQTMAQAQQLAPLSLRAPSRTVSSEDYELHARLVPGVARALMLCAPDDPTIPENSGDLLIVPVGGGAPTQELMNHVLRKVMVEYPNTLTFQVVARVHLRPGARPADVGNAIRQRLVERFQVSDAAGVPNPAIDFGARLRVEDEQVGSLAWSDIADLIIDTVGVRKLADGPDGLRLNGVAGDVALATREFPVLAGIQLFRADTGAEL
jgi:hypothetical protein